MAKLNPKTEPGFPPNCVTVEDAIQYIRDVFTMPGVRVERFRFECVTAKDATLKMSFDREDVGQPAEVEVVT